MSSGQQRRQARRRSRKQVTWWPVIAVIAVTAALGVAFRLAYLTGAFDALWPWGNGADESSVTQALPERNVSYTTWDPELSPEYYRVVGRAVMDVDVPVGEIWYAPLDSLGRTVRAAGCIDYETMRAGIERDRGELQGHDPSGWGHNGKVDVQVSGGEVYHGFFWNRSHLLAKSLGGSDEVENLICGTRMQNVGANDGEGGMAYGEKVARSWLYQHKRGWVYYSATPVYEGDELVCRSVIVDIKSHDGSLDLELEVYNTAFGHDINYATGEYSVQ